MDIFRRLTNHPLWRLTIDGIVVIAAGLFIIFTVLPLLLPFDYYEALPSGLEDRDTAIMDLLAEAPAITEQVLPTPPTLQFSSSTTVLSPATVYAERADTVVHITAALPQGEATGSGVFLSNGGLVATNYHVVGDAERVVVTTRAGAQYVATHIVAADEVQDIAIMQVDIPVDEITIAPIARTPAVPGTATYSIGHPEEYPFVMSDGLVSAIQDFSHLGLGIQLQITNPISAGSSGGPVFNQAGELIGLVAWSVEYGANAVQVQNLNFAIPIAMVVDLLGVLES